MNSSKCPYQTLCPAPSIDLTVKPQASSSVALSAETYWLGSARISSDGTPLVVTSADRAWLL
ncbi:hypothetical protein EV648_10262 [Kribbella sp. VKM Ac-2568]|nr:hypothetical protein EV648_10262 [Kribbella sp. VKM Ac-2568]